MACCREIHGCLILSHHFSNARRHSCHRTSGGAPSPAWRAYVPACISAKMSSERNRARAITASKNTIQYSRAIIMTLRRCTPLSVALQRRTPLSRSVHTEPRIARRVDSLRTHKIASTIDLACRKPNWSSDRSGVTHDRCPLSRTASVLSNNLPASLSTTPRSLVTG